MPKTKFYAQDIKNTDAPDVKELWGYLIHTDGTIISPSTHQPLMPQTHKEGYKFVFLTHRKRRVLMLIHRLVAEAFIPRPSDEHIFVRHIDFDKTNNQVSNLKWATQNEWQDRSTWNPNRPKGPKKHAIECYVNDILYYSLTDAMKALNIQNINNKRARKLIDEGVIILKTDYKKKTD